MPEPQHRTIDGLEVAYLEAGPVDGPLAVCLHGFPDSAHTWRHLLPRLADAGFHAVAPWIRGYAPSGLGPDGVHEVGALAADAVALRDALGGEGDAVLIGHDWGALATYAAVGGAPDRWSRAVVLSIPPGSIAAAGMFDYDNLKQRQWYQFFFCHPLADLVLPSDDFAFVDRLWADWSPGYDATDDLPAAKAALTGDGRVPAALSLYRTILGVAPTSTTYAAYQAASTTAPSCPTLYLHGRDDGCMPCPGQEQAEAAFPAAGSRVELVDQAGHFLQLEQPDEVNAHIVDFLTG